MASPIISGNPRQNGSYMFYALEPSTHYEVVISSKNSWGWSKNSKVSSSKQEQQVFYFIMYFMATLKVHYMQWSSG